MQPSQDAWRAPQQSRFRLGDLILDVIGDARFEPGHRLRVLSRFAEDGLVARIEGGLDGLRGRPLVPAVGSEPSPSRRRR